MISKHGSAKWSGGLKDGKGQVSTQSGSLREMDYSFAKRFEGQAGTNPEELLGAAHASCFAMAFSNILADFDLKADSIEAKSTVSLDPKEGAITKVHLEMTASIPGAEESTFMEAADLAKNGCPVSKLFDAEITLDAKLA